MHKIHSGRPTRKGGYHGYSLEEAQRIIDRRKGIVRRAPKRVVVEEQITPKKSQGPTFGEIWEDLITYKNKKKSISKSKKNKIIDSLLSKSNPEHIPIVNKDKSEVLNKNNNNKDRDRYVRLRKKFNTMRLQFLEKQELFNGLIEENNELKKKLLEFELTVQQLNNAIKDDQHEISFLHKLIDRKEIQAKTYCYNSEGFDIMGYDKNGYDRDGFDKSGFNNSGVFKNKYY